MKLENIEPLGRPQSDTVIVQLMTELGVSRTAMPKRFGKQNNACIFMTKNCMPQCTYFEFISPIAV